jgi:hypothetical protein
MIVDYSQYSTWWTCPWLWYEKYIKGMSPRYVGQRDDALALGTLCHTALDNWSKSGKMVIDQEVLGDINPTPECLALAEMLVRGYVMKYPREIWKVEKTEQAVKFPIFNPDYSIPKENVVEGVAKLDGYFYVSDDTTIESGLPGQTLTLSRGWWSREYKTKSAGIDRALWMSEWAAKRQADFQLLALNHLIETQPRHRGDDVTVQGVLVSVLEKPREYKPKRKCQGCKQSWLLDLYRATPEGFTCPVCNHVQKLKPRLVHEGPMGEYFRMIVTRTPDQLEIARQEIRQVANMMQHLQREGLTAYAPNRDNCIQNRYHKKCEFAEDHIAGTVVAEPKYIKIDPYKYIGL